MQKPPWAGCHGGQRVEKVFSPRCADFETFKKVSKSCLIERAVGFLPPAHTPRCSVASVFCGVFLQPVISLLATVLLLGLLPLAALADNNLVLHYDFQNGAGDTSGNGYDGTIQADSGAAAVLTETGGKNNGAALELTRGSNGAGGYVELPVAALTAITGDWSMNLWVKLTDNPTWNHIFSMGTDKNHYALLATVDNPYGTPVGLTMGINNGSGEYRVAAAPADTVLPGDWAMVTYCQDEQGRAAFYLNGQLVESTRCYYADMTEKGDGTIPVGFGDVAGSNNSGGVYFGKNAIFEDPATDGLIGEIRVYDDVLSGDAIAALYDAAMDSLEEMAFQDAYVGQVMSYFTNRDDTRGLKLAYVAKHGLMTGVGNGRFNPDGAVTRAMVWTVLARMAGEDTDGGATWYSKAQIWAMETGVSDGTKPMESITREQLAAMLYRFEGSPKVSGNLSAYPDGNTVSDWAADAMVWATETGLINGINGYLKPQSGATRAQLATMLMRFTA